MRTFDVLEALFPELLKGGPFIETRAFGAYGTRRDFAQSVREAMAAFYKVRQTHDVFFGVAARASRGGKKSELAYSRAVWADIDRPDSREQLEASGLPTPSLVVASGSSGHLQAYWLLDEPYDLRDRDAVAAFESYLRGIVQATAADLACVDATRIMRLPGSWNRKHAKPRYVEVVDYSAACFQIRAFPQGEVVSARDFEFGDAVEPAGPVRTDWARDILENGYSNQRNPNRSAVDFKLVLRLLDEGFEQAEVLWLVERSPAIGQRKREGYWRLTIENALRRLEG